MEKSEMVWIASIAVEKNLNYEDLKYSDYMYGNEGLIEDVWEYVSEYKGIGRIVFYEKYKEFKLY